MRLAWRVRGHFHNVLRDRRGISSLELIVIAPVLATALYAVIDLGNAAQQQNRLQQALNAGGQYAVVDWQVNKPADGSSVPTSCTTLPNTLIGDAYCAVLAAVPSEWSVTVNTPTLSCMCWTTSTSTRTACTGTGNKNGTCTATGETPKPELYISFSASLSYSSALLPSTITANYTARYQ